MLLREALFTLVSASDCKVCVSVCLSVCVYEIFVSFAFGRSGGVTLLLTGVLTQGSSFCCFGPEMNQFEIELPVNSSGLGVPKTVVFSQNGPV